MGATIRAVGHRRHPVLALPYQVMARHQVIIGSSGSGRTNLMIRVVRRRAARLRRARPLLAVMDCKGGPDSRVKAARTRRLLHAVGARRVAIWPDEAALSLRTLPPRDLAVLLFQLLRLPAEGPAAFCSDVTQAALMLAVTAPPGPPPTGAAFLDRLDARWLAGAYAGDPARLSAVDAARRQLPDIALRYRTLLERLGPAFDGTATLTDADAWYFILEGTREQSVAQAQAMAITELIAHAATHAEPRAMLLACDGHSAISGRVPLWQLYERGRSLGIGVQVSAQSWHGLGATDDDRYRIAATADGGIWLMRTPYPEPISQLLAAVAAKPRSRLVTADDWRMPGRGSATRPDLAGRAGRAVPGLASSMARLRPGRSRDRVRAVRPGLDPRRPVHRVPGVGASDLPDRDRSGRQHHHRAGDLRRAAVAPAGPRHARAHIRARRGAADRPARPDS